MLSHEKWRRPRVYNHASSSLRQMLTMWTCWCHTGDVYHVELLLPRIHQWQISIVICFGQHGSLTAVFCLTISFLSVLKWKSFHIFASYLVWYLYLSSSRSPRLSGGQWCLSLLSRPPWSTLFTYTLYNLLVSDILSVKLVNWFCSVLYIRHLFPVCLSWNRDPPLWLFLRFLPSFFSSSPKSFSVITWFWLSSVPELILAHISFIIYKYFTLRFRLFFWVFLYHPSEEQMMCTHQQTSGRTAIFCSSSARCSQCVENTIPAGSPNWNWHLGYYAAE